MNKKIFLSWLLMAILSLPVFAQIQEPVKFKTEWKSVSANEVEIVFTGKMEKDGTYTLRIYRKADLFQLLLMWINWKERNWLEN